MNVFFYILEIVIELGGIDLKRKKYDKMMREIDEETSLLEPIKEQLKINLTKLFRREAVDLRDIEGLNWIK